jgi:choline kinase
MVLEYQIQQIRKFNKKTKIYIGTGFESDKVKKLFSKYHDVYFIDNPDYENTNQSKLISIFAKLYEVDNLLVISNGILFRNNPFGQINNVSKIFVLDKPKNNFTIGCCESDKLNYLFYDLPVLWTECVFFNKLAIQQIKNLSDIRNIHQLYLFELVNKLIEEYDTSFAKEIIKKQNIMKINTVKDITKAKLFV